MAHICPECSVVCHCQGDIDDCIYPGREALCFHCDPDDNERDWDWNDVTEETTETDS